MSELTVRLLVGVLGTAVVASVLITVFVIRRRRRVIAVDAEPQAATTTERVRQPGWVQNIVVSVVASVISGIALFFIVPLFAPATSPTVDEPSAAHESVEVDGEDAVSELPSSLDMIQDETTPPTTEDDAVESDSETVQPVRTAEAPSTADTPVIDDGVEHTPLELVISDNTSLWEAALHEPEQLDEVAPAAERILVEGASATTTVELIATGVSVSPITAELRIQLDGASTTEVLSLAALAPTGMSTDLRVLIEGAATVEKLDALPPSHADLVLGRVRLLIEGAAITELLELAAPQIEKASI